MEALSEENKPLYDFSWILKIINDVSSFENGTKLINLIMQDNKWFGNEIKDVILHIHFSFDKSEKLSTFSVEIHGEGNWKEFVKYRVMYAIKSCDIKMTPYIKFSRDECFKEIPIDDF